jgi:hypothetical protein
MLSLLVWPGMSLSLLHWQNERLDSATGHALFVERSNTAKSYRYEALVGEARSRISVIEVFDGVSDTLVGHMRDLSLFFVGIFVDSSNGHSVSSEGFNPRRLSWL